MGRSADAHIGFGWVLPDSPCAWHPAHKNCLRNAKWDDCWDCVKDGEDYFDIDDNPILTVSRAGYLETEPQIILAWTDSLHSSYWTAKPFELVGLPDNIEEVMRKEAAQFGVRLPDEPAKWLLWPSYG